MQSPFKIYSNNTPLSGYSFFFLLQFMDIFTIMSNAAESICHKRPPAPFLSDMFLFLLEVHLWKESLDHVTSFACFPFGLSFKKKILVVLKKKKISLPHVWWELRSKHATVHVAGLCHHVDCRDWTQAVGLGKHLCLLSRSLALRCFSVDETPLLSL